MHAGGSPPHAPWDESTKTGHEHSFDSELSDDEVINTQKNLATDEGLFSQALTDAEYFSKLISPVKTKEEYMAESKKLLESDYEAEKQAIARQREEDKVFSMISFGARLATGRGDPLTILSEATQETVPELMAMRRATRVEETALAKDIKGEKAAIRQFALSEQKEDEVRRSTAMVERFYNISGQNFELKKMSTEHQHKLKSETKNAWDDTLKANVFVPLGQLLANPKRYLPEHKIGEPFEVFDTHSQTNVMFTDREGYDAAQKLAPSRYESARDDVHGVKRQFMGQFTHPTTGERLNRPGALIREMKDGSMWIADVKPQKEGEALSINDRIIIESSGFPKLIPLGKGTADLIPLTDVEMTANDIVGPKVMNELFGQALLYSDNIDSLAVVIDRAINQPDTVGIKGTIDYIKQVGAGVLSDFMGENALSTALTNAVAEGSTFLAEDAEISQEVLNKFGANQAQQIQDLLNADSLRNNEELQKKIFGNFRPELADNRARINAIVYALARARKSTGRLNMDDIQRAYQDIKITGVIDSATVAVKLTTIKNELLRAHRRTRLMYIHGGGEAGDILPLNYGSATSYQGAGTFGFSIDEDGNVGSDWTAGGSSATIQ
tara:strand:- start:84 stop:1919 length:1836 start_codon:yes stop_codon:yes gene_type:complete